jgi:hypothetical protein
VAGDDDRPARGSGYWRHLLPQVLPFGVAGAGLGVAAGLVFILVAADGSVEELLEPASGYGAVAGALLGALAGAVGGVRRARAERRLRRLAVLSPEDERALCARFGEAPKEEPPPGDLQPSGGPEEEDGRNHETHERHEKDITGG